MAGSPPSGEIIPVQNVNQIRDELPQPYRMIQKILDIHIWEAAWEKISAKFPLSERPAGLGDPRPGEKLAAPHTLYASCSAEDANSVPENVRRIVGTDCADAPLLVATATSKSLFLLKGPAGAVGRSNNGGSLFQETPAFQQAAYEPFDIGPLEHVTEGVHHAVKPPATEPTPEDSREEKSAGSEPTREADVTANSFVIVAVSSQSNEPTQASIQAQQDHREAAQAYAEARKAAVEADPENGATAELSVPDPGPEPSLVVNHRAVVEVVAVPVPQSTAAGSSTSAPANVESKTTEDAAEAAGSSQATTGDAGGSSNDASGEESSVVNGRVLLRWMAEPDILVTSLQLSPAAQFLCVGTADGAVRFFELPLENLESDGDADAGAKAKAAPEAPKSTKKASKKGKKSKVVEEEQRMPSLANTAKEVLSVSAAAHAVASAALFGEPLVPIVAFLTERSTPAPGEGSVSSIPDGHLITPIQLAKLTTSRAGGLILPDNIAAVAFVGWEDQLELLRLELPVPGCKEKVDSAPWNLVLPGGLRVLHLDSPSNHLIAAGMADGSTIIYSTAVPSSAVCLCDRKHMHPVAALAFSTPDGLEAGNPGSYLISTSVMGGIIVYGLPEPTTKSPAETCIRAMDADGTASPYAVGIPGAPVAIIGDDAPCVQLFDLTDGRPIASLLPSRADARAANLETPIHVCTTRSEVFLLLPKRRCIAVFDMQDIFDGVLSREERQSFGDEESAKAMFLAARIERVGLEVVEEATIKSGDLSVSRARTGLSLSSRGTMGTVGNRSRTSLASRATSPKATRRTTARLNSGYLNWKQPLNAIPWRENAWATRASKQGAPTLDADSDATLVARFNEWRGSRKEQRVEHNLQALEELLQSL